MQVTHEIFSNFPTQNELLENRELGWYKIGEILKAWGSDKHVKTMSDAAYKKITEIVKISNEITKLKSLEKKSKETKKEEKNSNNKYKDAIFSQELRYMLMEKLCLDYKLTEFIDNNRNDNNSGEVKDNTEKFENFCMELLKETYIIKSKTAELNLGCNSNEGDTYPTENVGLTDEKKNDLKDNKSSETSEHNEADDKTEDTPEMSNNNKKIPILSSILSLIKQYYFDSLKKDENDNMLKIFLLSYFTIKKKIEKNKEMSPADMADEFQDENIQKELEGKIKSDEKERVLRTYLDPYRFWEDFETDFLEQIELFSYETILIALLPLPKPVIKKDKDGKEYRAKEYTKTHDRKMKEINDKFNKFIDKCAEDLKKNPGLQEQINNLIKEQEIKKTKDEVLENCIDEMKIKQEIKFQKTTRAHDVKVKAEMTEKLKDEKLKPCGRYNEETLSLYANRKIEDENRKEEIIMHLQGCKKCRDFLEVIKQAFGYRQKTDREHFFMIRKPYDKPIQSLTEEEYLKQSDNDYYNKRHKENPCRINAYYLVLSLIKSGNIEEANKVLEDCSKVHKDGIFVNKTKIDLKKINI